jgi:hypothetical protein
MAILGVGGERDKVLILRSMNLGHFIRRRAILDVGLAGCVLESSEH